MPANGRRDLIRHLKFKNVKTPRINRVLRRAHCAAVAIRTGGGVVGGGDNKEIHAAVSSVPHIRLQGPELP